AQACSRLAATWVEAGTSRRWCSAAVRQRRSTARMTLGVLRENNRCMQGGTWGMVAHTQSIHILDPCPEESPEVRDTSAALAGIGGKVIGLLENRKYHADAFLQELHKVLEQEYGVKRVVYATKFSYSAPCAEETIATLVAECDAIIHGIAD